MQVCVSSETAITSAGSHALAPLPKLPALVREVYPTTQIFAYGIIHNVERTDKGVVKLGVCSNSGADQQRRLSGHLRHLMQRAASRR